MNIAYLITAHSDAKQLKRLVDALQPDAQFFIHIDAKSDISAFAPLVKGPNVRILDERIDVRKDTILEVDCQMLLLNEAVSASIYFDKIFFLDESDYPLKSNGEILDWLDHNRDKEFIKAICMDTEDIEPKMKAKYTTPRPFFNENSVSEKWNKGLTKIKRKINTLKGVKKTLDMVVTPDVGLHPCILPLPEVWHLYKGFEGWCISEEMAKYIIDVYAKCPEVRKYFEDSFRPIETFVHTIVFNTHEWAVRCQIQRGKYPGKEALSSIHFIVDTMKGCRSLDASDYDNIASCNKFFARKMTSGNSETLIERIDNGRR